MANSPASSRSHLFVNQLTALPESIGQLAGLQSLNVWNNKLTALPESIGQLAGLQSLDLGFNQLTALPESIRPTRRPASRSTSASISWTALPESIGQLAGLQSLIVWNNKLTALPESIRPTRRPPGAVPSREPGAGTTAGNPGPDMESISFDSREKQRVQKDGEELRPADPKDILHYYFQQDRQPKRRLNEAKVLIVGQGGVGKTSLVKRLVWGKFDPDEKKTEGIRIETWMIDPPEDPAAAGPRESRSG